MPRQLPVVSVAFRRLRLRVLPLRNQFRVAQRAEPDAPPFEHDDLDGLLARLVDALPGFFGGAVARARVLRFVVGWDRGGLLARERGEDGGAQSEVVGRWLPAVLDERVARVGLREGELGWVREVEVVDAEDGGGEQVRRGAQGRAEGCDLVGGRLMSVAMQLGALRLWVNLFFLSAHQRRLPRALHAVQAQEERPAIVAVLLAVGGDAVEDEGDAVLGLVVDDGGHCCGLGLLCVLRKRQVGARGARVYGR